MAAALRILLVEGNTRRHNAAAAGKGIDTNADQYAAVLRAFEPAAVIDLCHPADSDAVLPAGTGLSDYDGVVYGGSALHLHAPVTDPAVRRQVDFAGAVFASGLPFLGSCWGLQVAAVAAGGTVSACAKGREVGVARGIQPTDAGAESWFLAGRGSTFDAPAIHADEVTALPEGATVLAANGHSSVQAAVIHHGGGTFYGVQYHPEFTLGHVGDLIGDYAPVMARDGVFETETAARDYAEKLQTLERDGTPVEAPGIDVDIGTDMDIGTGVDIGADLLDVEKRAVEIKNWLAYCRRSRAR